MSERKMKKPFNVPSVNIMVNHLTFNTYIRFTTNDDGKVFYDDCVETRIVKYFSLERRNMEDEIDAENFMKKINLNDETTGKIDSFTVKNNEELRNPTTNNNTELETDHGYMSYIPKFVMIPIHEDDEKLFSPDFRIEFRYNGELIVMLDSDFISRTIGSERRIINNFYIFSLKWCEMGLYPIPIPRYEDMQIQYSSDNIKRDIRLSYVCRNNREKIPELLPIKYMEWRSGKIEKASGEVYISSLGTKGVFIHGVDIEWINRIVMGNDVGYEILSCDMYPYIKTYNGIIYIPLVFDEQPFGTNPKKMIRISCRLVLRFNEEHYEKLPPTFKISYFTYNELVLSNSNLKIKFGS